MIIRSACGYAPFSLAPVVVPKSTTSLSSSSSLYSCRAEYARRERSHVSGIHGRLAVAPSLLSAPIYLSLARARVPPLGSASLLRTRHAHKHAHTVVDNALGASTPPTDRPSSHWHSVDGHEPTPFGCGGVRSWIVRGAALREAIRCRWECRRHRLVAVRGALVRSLIRTLALARLFSLASPAMSGRTQKTKRCSITPDSVDRPLCPSVERGEKPDRGAGVVSPRRGARARTLPVVRLRVEARDGRRTTVDKPMWHCTRYPVCQRPGKWIRSLRSKTGCIKRGERLRRPPAVLRRRPLCGHAVHGGAGVAPASLYSQPFVL